MAMNQKFSSSGFTLVELAVVVLIIGFLVGGIIAGQSAIKSAKIRAVLSEIQEYQGAFALFVDKYNNLPGDYTRAAGTGNPFTLGTSAGETGNGNGDGQISWATDSGAQISGADTNEGVMAWQHLALEGLIDGQYTTHTTAANDDANPGTNVPQSSLANTVGYSFDYNATTGANNHILLGAEDSTGINDDPAISVADAKKIDEKIDDGRPSVGTVLARGDDVAFANCVDDNSTASDFTDDTYDIQDKSSSLLECILAIQMK